MTRRKKFFLFDGAILAIVAGFTAFSVLNVDGGQWQRHDKMWFATHPAERHKVMDACRADSRIADSYECRNAFSGELSPHMIR